MIAVMLAATLAVGQAHEALLDCYVGYMKIKGVTLASPERDVRKFDGSARQYCAGQYTALAKKMGEPKAERTWRGLWAENAARD